MKIIVLMSLMASIILQSCTTTNLSNDSNRPTPQYTVEPKGNESNEADFYPIGPCTDKEPIRQNPSSNGTRAVEGGLLNRSVICGTLPTAAIPDLRSSGTVSVEVLFDENGKVVSAKSSEADRSLADSATQAARSTQFKPTYLGGQAMKVRGVLRYKFVCGRGFWLQK